MDIGSFPWTQIQMGFSEDLHQDDSSPSTPFILNLVIKREGTQKKLYKCMVAYIGLGDSGQS